MWFNCLKATESVEGDSLLFTIKHPGNSWYSLNRPWNQPVIFNLRPVDWKSSTLISRSSHLPFFLILHPDARMHAHTNTHTHTHTHTPTHTCTHIHTLFKNSLTLQVNKGYQTFMKLNNKIIVRTVRTYFIFMV